MFKKILLTFGASLSILVLNTLGGVLTARLLGPEGKGELSAVILWPSVLATVGNLGLVEAIVYFAGRESEDRLPSLIANGLWAVVLQTALLIPAGSMVIPLLMSGYQSEVVNAARLYLAFIPLNLLTLYLASIFQGRLRMRMYNAIRVLVVAGYVIGLSLLAAVGQISVYNCTLVLLGSNLALLGFELVYVVKLRWLSVRSDFPLLCEMLRYGIRTYAGNLSSQLNMRLDQMLMAAMLPPRLLGLYVVAVTMSGGVSLVSGAFAMVTFPAVAGLTTERERSHAFARFLRIDLWISLLVAAVFLALLPWLVPLLFGPAFTDAVPANRVLVIAAVVGGMNTVFAAGLKGWGNPLISSAGEILSLVCTVGFLALLLPRWGILGAASSALLAALANFIWLFGYTVLKFNISPWKMVILHKEDLSSLTGSIKAFFWRGAPSADLSP